MLWNISVNKLAPVITYAVAAISILTLETPSFLTKCLTISMKQTTLNNVFFLLLLALDYVKHSFTFLSLLKLRQKKMDTTFHAIKKADKLKLLCPKDCIGKTYSYCKIAGTGDTF